MKPSLQVDHTANAAYLQLGESPVVETREAAEGVLVDLDEFGVVVGIEVLDLDVFIPRAELLQYNHIRSDQLDLFDQIRPSVTSFVARQPRPVVDDCDQGSRVTA